MLSRRPIALAVTCLMILAFASTAQAALPKTKTNRIVPGEEVAGVKLGMKMKRAANVWKMEEGNGCFLETFPEDEYKCIFEVESSGANYNTGNISYSGKSAKGTVRRILLRSPHDGNRPIFSSKMNRYKTSKGVGIGATKKKLSSEFGQKLKKKGSSGGYTTYRVTGPKKATTTFTVYSGQISSIELKIG
jgi:hypothetical protein